MELDLLPRMDREEPAITASEASNHFSLWSSCTILSFFTEVEQKQKQHISAVEKGRRSVVKSCWILQLDPVLQGKVARYIKEEADSLVDLLLFVRNLSHHYIPHPRPSKKTNVLIEIMILPSERKYIEI